MPVGNAWRILVRTYRLQQRFSQLPFIFCPQSKCGLKEAGFMLPIFMRGAQAIPTELTGINVRMFRIWQLHLAVPSTIPIFSSVGPYSSYTSRSICPRAALL
jgi:hypothetical protein